VRRRIALYAAAVAAVLGAVVALIACGLFALAGHGPSAGRLLLVVLLTALACALLARVAVARITLAGLAAFAARRVAARRRRRLR
jgi:uncharacterized membrane protein (DUF441 family)